MSKTPRAADAHVGKRVRMRRLMLEITQGKLAKRLGVTFQQVQKYEKGINRISVGRLQEMAHILQVPVQFFFDGLPVPSGGAGKGREERSPQFASEFLASADGLALARAFVRLKNRKLRRHIVRMVAEIAGESTNEE